MALSDRLPSLEQYSVYLGSDRRSEDLCHQNVKQVLVQRYHLCPQKGIEVLFPKSDAYHFSVSLSILLETKKAKPNLHYP